MSDIGYWWCRSCKCEVAPSGVTFSEHHEDCGCRVEWLVGHELTCIEELEAKLSKIEALPDKWLQRAGVGGRPDHVNPYLCDCADELQAVIEKAGK